MFGSIVLPSLAVLGIQFLLLYGGKSADSASGVKVVFFSELLWEGGKRHMLLKLGRDLAFPALVLFMTVMPWIKREVLIGEVSPDDRKRIHFSIMLYFAAILIFSVFEESGPRAGHGNFSWGVYLAWFTMFLYLVPFFFQCMGTYRKNCLIRKTSSALGSLYFLAGTALLLFHLLSGLYYFGIIASGGLYLR